MSVLSHWTSSGNYREIMVHGGADNVLGLRVLRLLYEDPRLMGLLGKKLPQKPKVAQDKIWPIFAGLSMSSLSDVVFKNQQLGAQKCQVPAASKWQKGITDILIICQLYSYVMGERHILHTFVLQVVKMLPILIWSCLGFYCFCF